MANNNNKVIPEIFLLRSVACLSIALMHSLTRAYGEGSDAVNVINTLLTFGTPTFVFISAFILSYSYPERTPAGFWPKRIKYLLLPYLVFGAVYAFMKAVEQSAHSDLTLGGAFLELLWRHILIGDYHGYFILIIFQFYLLHMAFQKYGPRYSARTVIGVSFLLNIGYLAFFNFTKPLGIPQAEYIWYKGYWLPFVGWVVYFAIAYYAGRSYESFRAALRKRAVWVVLAPFAAAAATFAVYRYGGLTLPSSKRVDMLFFTVAMIFLLYLIASRVRTIPRPFVWISRYSFGIYLLHPLFLALLAAAPGPLAQLHPLLQTAVNLAICVLGSIAVVHVLVKVPFGSYVVGKLGVGSVQDKPKSAGIGPAPADAVRG